MTHNLNQRNPSLELTDFTIKFVRLVGSLPSLDLPNANKAGMCRGAGNSQECGDAIHMKQPVVEKVKRSRQSCKE